MLPKIGILYIPGPEFQECLEKFSAIGTITAIIDFPHSVDLLVIPDSLAFNFLSPKVKPFRRHFTSSAVISNYVDNFVTHLWDEYYQSTKIVAFGASALTLHMAHGYVTVKDDRVFLLDHTPKETITSRQRYFTIKPIQDEFNSVVKWFGGEDNSASLKAIRVPVLRG